MSSSHDIGLGEFDKCRFLRYMNKHGTAYQNQAMELISICRVFALTRAADQIFSQDTELNKVLQTCDNALAEAAEAGEDTTVSSDHRIDRATQKLQDYEKRYHRNQSSAGGVMERMQKARDKDSKKRSWREFLPFKKTSASSKVVDFRIMTDITDTRPILVQQALTIDGSNMHDILWNFNRFSRNRVTLAQNPHFYEHEVHERFHIRSLNAYQDRVIVDPIDSHQNANIVDVLTNKPSRIFLEFGEKSRAFDNVWETNGILVFKSVCGKLEGESIVRAAIQDIQAIQGRPCKWCRVCQWPVPPGDWIPVQDWKEVFEQVLHSQDVKICITVTDNTEAVPS